MNVAPERVRVLAASHSEEMAPSKDLRLNPWWIQREPPRTMYGDEFYQLIRQYRHPRFLGGSIRVNRFGQQARRSMGMVAGGTVFFTDLRGIHDAMNVPIGEIPYATRRPSLEHWDEDFARFRGQHQIVPGWRSMLEALIQSAALRPDDELSCLIGQDSFKLQPRKYRVL